MIRGDCYSEDIDLVQVDAEPAGPIMEAVRELLDPWLGVPQYRQSRAGITFRYRFDSEGAPSIPLRLKIEINTREHFSVSGFTQVPFEVSSRWFDGSCAITSYDLNELLGTKLRALYQRKKGRDLFDLAHALRHPTADPDRIIKAFNEYMRREGHHVTRAEFERNLSDKLLDGSFTSDVAPLLASSHTANHEAMAEVVSRSLISRLVD